MPKLILGLVGQAGAGKFTATECIKNDFNIQVFIFSDILKDMLKRMFLPASRENLIALSTAVRQAFGQDALSNAMERQVAASEADIVVVDGIRRFDDIADLKKNPSFHLIEVWAPPETRFERLKKRNEKPGETEMTWEDFLAMSQKETEATIAGVAAQAEKKIDNHQGLPELKKSMLELIQSYIA